MKALLHDAACRLSECLRSLDVNSLSLDTFYRDRYLQEKMGILESSLIRSRMQLVLALGAAPDLSRVVLIDHGGGTGTTGMLAKLAGVGTVVYNDIDPKFLDTARKVGHAIGAESDHYVLGDVDVLMAYLREHRLACDALVSYDVIEHIHDMDRFIATLGSLTERPFTAVMSSGANPFSPRYLHYVLPIQRKLERDWLLRREEIVRELAPEMSPADVARLAAATRKHIRPEIERVVRRFKQSGTLDEAEISETNRYDLYGSNTCNPDTGWWAEHLMNPWRLKRKLEAQGFDVRVRNGLYGRPSRPVKRLGAILANGLVRALGPAGIAVAAYYTLWARKPATVHAGRKGAS